MAVPVWFDQTVYFKNKLLALGDGWTEATLKAAFEDAGFSVDAEGLYRHFVEFGNAESISPNAWFDTEEYLHNKAADFYGVAAATQAQAQRMSTAMLEVGMSPWEHYQQFWAENYAKNGTFNNPSDSFDVAAYMTDKLAQVQAAEPDANWTMDSLVEAFLAAGLSPVEHYLAFGAGEGLIPEAVSAGDSGTVDNVPDNDAFDDSGMNDSGMNGGGINGGPGDDIIVLGHSSPDGNVVALNGSFGNDTLIGFQSGSDRINVAGALGVSEGTALNHNPAHALTQNSAVVTAAAGAFEDTGLFSATAVSALLDDNILGFDAAAPDEATALVFLQAGNAAGQNVYTVVKLSNSAGTPSFDILGSITLDAEHGVAQGLASTDLVSASALQYVVYNADSYTQLAGTDTTVHLNPNYNNTCADLNAESLVNANGQAITKLEGGNGDDTFTLTGTPASSLTLEGGGGNDCLVLSGSLGTNSLDNVIFDGGAGTNSVQLESSEAISLSLANIRNVSEFIITERQTGDVTLDLGAGTAGMRVDASRASASLELTTSGHGDTIILSEENGKTDTIILTPNNTGETDRITGFTAGASGDKLDVKEYFDSAPSIDFKTKDAGREYLVVSEDSVGVFYNFSGDDLEISPNSEGLTYEKGTIYITSGKSCFILFTSATATDPSASYTVGQIIGETFSVVGTLDTVGAALLTEGNFDLV